MRSPMVRGVVGSVVVAVASLVTSVVPPSSWVASFPITGDLRATLPGRMVGLSFMVAGLGLMAWAWLSVGRKVMAGLRPPVLRMAACWSVPLLLIPPLFSRDAWSYAAQGALVAEGFNPYDVGPGVLSGHIVEAVDPMWLQTPAPYGPLPLAYGGLVARLTMDPYVLMLAHRLLAVLGIVLIAWAVPRLATACRVDPVFATWLVVANPVLITHGIGAAHNDVLMLGLACSAFALALMGRWGTAAVVAGAAAAVKLPGGLVVIAIAAVMSPLAGRALRFASLAIAGAVSVLTLVTIGELTGVGSGWLGALDVPGLVRSPFSIANLIGMAASGVLGWLGEDTAADQALQIVRLVGMIAAVTLIVVLSLRSSVHHAARAVGIALLAVVVLGPSAHDWYFLWCLPFLAVARPGRRLTTTITAVSLIFTIAAPLNSSLRGATIPILTTTALAIATIAPLLNHLRTLHPVRKSKAAVPIEEPARVRAA
ncbi:alpha-1,6-mannosyltransferase [Kribbella steppae]|uniref:Alpha-1,6-mannosyltransferase n=1 Tax=Kribbella steppae TaxID=2512223 RepID=A0A4R2HK79_9ACTN|nr:polyprenol phosphomannose-dependent alpha 1,6 mannosyltransferase MptB [Kribbella steppae]TCO30175.1 alpha-1,6-mannosyltransferase [Kribbella steppae]